ncbi:conserved exported hypothetical protein [Candidatus Sulfopaludibacter sp. SbA3]|nr:conserved exported hypothetical protein [Candidatus Sulfopaludibacter sp. SbA3]
MRYTLWLLLLATAAAQSERPAFEVASVKASKLTGGPLRVTAPDEPAAINYTNVTLLNCIRRAYGLKSFQVSGGPDWVSTERYVINAKAASAVPHPQLMLMLQGLLAERFQLVVHREMKEIAAYELTVAKNGPKMKKAEDDATQIDSNAQHALIGHAVSMGLLAGALRLDRPVFDATGLDGLYDVTLDYARDDEFAIFTALQEQLGLKLEQHKHSVEVLVIDRAQKPPEN